MSIQMTAGYKLPKGYADNRRLRIALATELHFANDEGKRLDRLIRFKCSTCRKSTPISDLNIIGIFQRDRFHGSYEEPDHQLIYYRIDCPCGAPWSIPTHHLFSHKLQSFKSYTFKITG